MFFISSSISLIPSGIINFLYKDLAVFMAVWVVVDKFSRLLCFETSVFHFGFESTFFLEAWLTKPFSYHIKDVIFLTSGLSHSDGKSAIRFGDALSETVHSFFLSTTFCLVSDFIFISHFQQFDLMC